MYIKDFKSCVFLYLSDQSKNGKYFLPKANIIKDRVCGTRLWTQRLGALPYCLGGGSTISSIREEEGVESGEF